VSCEGDAGGNIRLRYIADRAVSPQFALIDENQNVHPGRVIERHASPLVNANLVQTDTAPPHWQFQSEDSTFQGGRDLSEEWTLRGVQTAFLMSGRNRLPTGPVKHAPVGKAVLASPLTGPLHDLSPGTRYEFTVLAAVHRCAGDVQVHLLQADGSATTLACKRISDTAIGGPDRSRYDRVVLQFIAPPSPCKCSFSVEKGPTEFGEDSYVFLAEPCVRRVAAASSGSPISLPREFMGPRFQNPSLDLVDVTISPPAHVAADARLVFRMATDNCVIDRPVRLIVQSRIRAAAVLDCGAVRFEGETPFPDTAITLSIYVDAELSARSEFPIIDGKFLGALSINSRHLDGLPHAVELRATQENIPLKLWMEILPSFVTPWDALQKYARMPLGLSKSPASQHHFRALRRWFDAMSRGEGELPPVGRLHDILLAGVKTRTRYEPLAFPRSDHPVVSVVVPVHNRFDLTYFCLCALLFAHNRVKFEVIVVDDGSSDTTLELADIVSGIKLVRHEKAKGFVGACNAGAWVAAGDYIAFLNNDTEVTAGWLDELVETFENFNDVGLAGAKLVYPDGRLQEAGGIVWRSGNPWNVGRGGNAEDPAFNYLRQVDYMSGAAIMLRRDLFGELGSFSEEMAPAYFEDTDLAMKVREAGKRVVYVPTSVVFHYEGQSAGTSVASGMKRYQEINRPKFKRKWSHLYGRNGAEGVRPDLERDRGAVFRVLFIDSQFPLVDQDAGSYAAFQEIRLLQGLGAKVAFLPRNMAWLDRHTLALERIGVECLYSPFVANFEQFLREHAGDFDLVYVCRYNLAREVIPLVRAASGTRIAFNLADLHFLREMREALAGSEGYSFESAKSTRDIELEQVAAADLVLSYSDVEIAVLQSHLGDRARIAKLPWVVETPPEPITSFERTSGAIFIGSYGHPPNVGAVKFFVEQILPKVRERHPDFVLRIVGGQLVDEVRELASPSVEIVGYVEDLDDAFRTCRVFVAPLLAGAGIKGKVLEAAARGVPSVLSPIAAEGTGLTDGVDCLVAYSVDAWVDAVSRLNSDEALWSAIAARSQEAARTRFSFEKGLDTFAEALAKLDIYGCRDNSLVYRHARPHKYGRD
jgi:GT2 family glycosyltransferase/glycosyltransferase involved in cell wall biosynthesis